MAEPSLAPDSPLALDVIESPLAQGKKPLLRFSLADDVALLTEVATRDQPFLSWSPFPSSATATWTRESHKSMIEDSKQQAEKYWNKNHSLRLNNIYYFKPTTDIHDTKNRAVDVAILVVPEMGLGLPQREAESNSNIAQWFFTGVLSLCELS